MTKAAYLLITILFIGLMCASQALAFSYTPSLYAENPPETEILLINQFMSRAGLQPLSPKSAVLRNVMYADQIYSSPDLKRAVFLKFGLLVSDVSRQNQIMKVGEGFLIHKKIPNIEIDYALFFYDFSKNDAELLAQKLTRYLSGEEVAFFHDRKCSAKVSASRKYISGPLTDILFFGQPVYAAADNCEDGRTAMGFQSPLAQVQATRDGVVAQGLLSQVGSCLISTLNGLKDSAVQFKDKISMLFTQPEKLWQSTVDTFKNFREVVYKIGDSLKQVLPALAALPIALMNQLTCLMVGALGPALVKALTPAGLAALGITLAAVIQRLSSSKKIFEAAARIQKTDSKKAETLINSYGVCLAR